MSFRMLPLFAMMVGLMPVDAGAVEVQFEGSYRTRSRLFDSLSLDRKTYSNAEGLSWAFQHRLWLRPKLLVNDNIGLFMDLKGFDNVSFGDETYVGIDPLSGDPVATELSDILNAPTSATDSRSPLLDFTLWRAWGEVHTRYFTFKFGRMPLDWGLGIWQNDGLRYNADYGDSADRLMVEAEISQVYVRAAVDVNTEGFINQKDDTTSYSIAAAYRSERITGGLQGMLRRTPSRDLTLFFIDASADIELGIFSVSAEGVGVFGGGNLSDGINDARISAFGAALDARVHLRGVEIGLLGAFASGDGDDTDANLKTYTFDPDYNVGFMIFEQSMPVFQATVPDDTNGGREGLTGFPGNGVSNALLIRPLIVKELPFGFSAEAAMTAARVARVPVALRELNRRAYGMEFDATVRWRGYDHFEAAASFGAFVPGTYYREYADDTYTDGFRAVVLGGQLITRIRF